MILSSGPEQGYVLSMHRGGGGKGQDQGTATMYTVPVYSKYSMLNYNIFQTFYF